MISQLSMAKEGWKNGKGERNKITSVLSSRPHTVCSLLLSTRLDVCANTGAQLHFLRTFFFPSLSTESVYVHVTLAPSQRSTGALGICSSGIKRRPPSLHPPRPARKKKNGNKRRVVVGGEESLAN